MPKAESICVTNVQGKEESTMTMEELIEQRCAEAFMEGYKYAIRVLQDAINNTEKTQ